MYDILALGELYIKLDHTIKLVDSMFLRKFDLK